MSADEIASSVGRHYPAWVLVDPQDRSSRQIYNLMTCCIVPRPIAWVSTCSRDGTFNLAPFSYFNGITSKPPLLSISAGRRRGARKDTTNNASATGELVVNIVTADSLRAMVQTSADYTPEISEFAEAGVTPLDSVRVKPPRVAEAPIQLECRVREIIEISPGIADLIIAEVLLFHVADELEPTDELVFSANKLRPVGRLGGSEYALFDNPIKVPRPKV